MSKSLDFQGFKAILNFQIFAVICTFSFGSAFANSGTYGESGTYYATKVQDQLLTDKAFKAGEEVGNYGTTEAYRDYVLDNLNYFLNCANSDTEVKTDYPDVAKYGLNMKVYYTAEKATAKEKVEAAVEAVKAAKTANEIYTIYDDLKTALGKLLKTKIQMNYLGTTTNAGYVAAWKPATTTTFGTINTPIFNNTLVVGFGTQVVTAVTNYLLPGYGYLVAESDLTYNNATVISWFVDNGYRTLAQAKAHVADFQAALVPITPDETKKVQAEFNAIEVKAAAAARAYNQTPSEATSYAYVTGSFDLDQLEAIYEEEYAFGDKYCLLDDDGNFSYSLITAANTAFGSKICYCDSDSKYGFSKFNSLEGYLGYMYMHQLDAEVKAVDLTDKAAVIALADKLYDVNTKYYDSYLTLTPSDTLEVILLGQAYDKFVAADKKELNNAFKAFKAFNSTTDSLGIVYLTFDKSEKNVAAIENARKLYDEYVANYGYNHGYAANEAMLLAAEHNKTVSAGYDEKQDSIDNTKLQAFLNNATLSVKSTKLAAKKVKVQAKFAADDYEGIVGQFENGYTMEYKFYHKAPGKSYKLTKTKAVNYITYTSKSLKAGKNYFKVGVVVKNADGKVVATKLYSASGAAYRTIK